MLGRYTTGPRGPGSATPTGPLSRYARSPMPNTVDLRSDTVTHPTPEMRRAMAAAELGDDVWGDDPTVIALEERAAELTGKEAALFVASGTMGNLVSEMAHVPRGGEIIVGHGGHSFQHEAGNFAVVVGASIRTLPGISDGRMDLDDIRDAFRDPEDVHDPITSLVIVREHALGLHGPAAACRLRQRGRPPSAHERGVPLHVDGARIFNAAVALGTTARSPARGCRLGFVLPLQGTRRARSARSSSGPATSSGVPVARESWSAAACARWACSRRQA